MTREDFIKRAEIVHQGQGLDYSEVEYKNNRTPVKIIDPVYGAFWQTPSNHLKGQCHPMRKSERISKANSLTQEEVISRFKEVHKDENLDYSEVVYKNMHTKVKIISHDIRPDGTEYGAFWQEPVVHLKGCTHPDISRDRQVERTSSNTEEFVEKAKRIHVGKNYNFSRVDYVNNRTKVRIICPKHGEFKISPDNFLAGKGCPMCGHSLSKAEKELMDFISSFYNGNIINRDRSLLGGLEVDICIPEKHIAFEFNGLRWHTEGFGKNKWYHLHKKEECNKAGFALFSIFEDEWLQHREALLSKVRRILGGCNEYPKIGARKTVIKEASKDECEAFVNRNHIQGFVNATVHLGGFYERKLVAVMSFTRRKEDKWEMVRFCSDIDYIIQGMCSKFVSHFVKHYHPSEIKTFLDRRWERNIEDNVYTKCGFVLKEILPPDYRYTNGHGKRIHKFAFRKNKLHRRYGLALSMTEKEMAKELGYDRIWDCGLVKYIWTPASF